MERQEAAPATAAAELLVKNQYLALVRLARQLVDDLSTAQDVVQDVCIRMLDGDLGAIRNPNSYMRTAVVNGCRSALRTRRTRRLHEFGIDLPALAEYPSPDNFGDPLDQSSDLLVAIDRLPRRQREIVVLRYYEDLSISEIAEVLDVSSHAVSASHLLAMKALREALNARHGEQP